MDAATVAAHICASASTVERWVEQGILPPPRKRGGKLMWSWAEVDDHMKNGGQDGGSNQPGSIADAVKREREADRHADH